MYMCPYTCIMDDYLANDAEIGVAKTTVASSSMRSYYKHEKK